MDDDGLGPFFALESWRAGDGWRPLDDVVSDPLVIAERVSTARTVMAERAGLPASRIDPRAMASVVSLGLFARLLSPPFGTAVRTGVVPALTIATLWWKPVGGGPWPMATSAGEPTPPARAASPESVAARFAEQIVAGVAAPVLAVFAAEYRLSEKVLWGNVGSALGGAAGMLTTGRPELADRAADLAERILAVPPLLGTGRLAHPDPDHPRRFFVRRSCCLFYRIPGGGTCGDCILIPADVRRQQWRVALTR
ncbi:(2Fe-2S)-binding protein [Micromonospora yasonensis]|uniref:(2Fe-2S)-binding protein n=1 Tax=Micromonospora yasonensis TaxID=1128667 RepID=UPI00222F06D7|nr:(2Fe-2S)-binding protein [Micromonospora yasonensis]MCW3841193.1 (2Fe-2S)-binding protein [Micromonospora yasonensis]